MPRPCLGPSRLLHGSLGCSPPAVRCFATGPRPEIGVAVGHYGPHERTVSRKSSVSYYEHATPVHGARD
eukprot:6814906-Prymnesium_polylepis.1